MSSYFWRADTDSDSDGLGKRNQSTGVTVIEFTATNVTDGKHIHQHALKWSVGFAENERPKIPFNEIQDTSVESLTFTITGTVENPSTNGVMQTMKEWLIEDKTNTVYTKGRFGVELDNFDAHDVTPASTGTTSPVRPEQARGLILVDWEWIFTGEWPSKADFVATVRFNGNHGSSSTSPKYDWTAIFT